MTKKCFIMTVTIMITPIVISTAALTNLSLTIAGGRKSECAISIITIANIILRWDRRVHVPS